MLYPSSIKWRLQIWHSVLLCLVCVTLLFAYHRSQFAADVARLDREHRLVLLAVLPELRQPRNFGPPPPPDRGPRPGGGENTPDAYPEETNPALADFISAGGVVAQRSPGRRPRHHAGSPEAPWPEWIEQAGEEPGTGHFDHAGYRVVWHVRRPGEVVVLGSPLAPLEARSRNLAWRLAAAGCAVVVLGIAAGAWLIARALRPIEDIGNAARKIANGTLAERVPVPAGGGELARLCTVLNDCFTRVELTFEQQSRFIADASHELRTPLAVILNESQLALRRERPAAEYRSSLEVCAEAAGRMRRLVDDLLTLARTDARSASAARTDCDLADIVRSAAAFLAPVAAERSITIETDAGSAPFLGDAAGLERALVNLLANALRHSPPGEVVRLESAREGDLAVARVIDRGPGIPPELRPRLFERFQRGDPSRTREQGAGAGLGLAISRAIVESHGGSLACDSDPGVRTEFTLRLPATPG